MNRRSTYLFTVDEWDQHIRDTHKGFWLVGITAFTVGLIVAGVVAWIFSVVNG